MPPRRPVLAVPAVALLALLSGGCSGEDRTAPTSSSGQDGSAPPSGGAPAGPSAPPPPAATGAPSAEAPSGGAAPSTAAAPTTPAAPPAASASTGASAAEPSGAPLTVIAVRVARQEGFDRVVLELAGAAEGVPGWRVAYEQDPRRDGSGEPVQVAGAAVLAVRVLGAGYPFDTGQTEVSSVSVPGDTVVVQDVQLGSVFEGTYEAFVGVRERAPFTVTRLTGPARVVIDVQHG